VLLNGLGLLWMLVTGTTLAIRRLWRLRPRNSGAP
jgi:hypothetical protein